jgi:hypothetical protein
MSICGVCRVILQDVQTGRIDEAVEDDGMERYNSAPEWSAETLSADKTTAPVS